MMKYYIVVAIFKNGFVWLTYYEVSQGSTNVTNVC